MLTDARLIELQQDVSWYAQYDGTYRIDCGELLELLDGYSTGRVCPDCHGAGTLGRAPDGRLIACETCGGHEDAAGTGRLT